MKLRKLNNKGFSHVEMAIVVLVVAALGFVGYRVLKNTSHAGSNCAGQTLRFDNQKIGYGSTGKCVSDLQVLAGAYLGTPIKVDGKYGPITKKLVINLQKKVFPTDSTQSDGIAGVKTWGKVCALVPKLQTKTIYDAQMDACGKTTFKLVLKSTNPVIPKSTSPIDSVNNLGIQNPDEITSDNAGNIYVLSHGVSNGAYGYSVSAINPNTRKLIKNYPIQGCYMPSDMKISENVIYLVCNIETIKKININSGAQDILDLSNISCDSPDSFCSGNANTYVVKNGKVFFMGVKYDFAGWNAGKVEPAFFSKDGLLFADYDNAMDINDYQYSQGLFGTFERLSKDDLTFANYSKSFGGNSYICDETSKSCTAFKLDSSMNDIKATKTSCFLSNSCIAAIDYKGRIGSVNVLSYTMFNPYIFDLPVYASWFTDNWVLGTDKSSGSEKLVNIVYPTRKVGNVYDAKDYLNYPIGMVQDTSRNLWILNDAVRDTDGSILKTAYLTEISESGKLLGTAR